MGEPGRVETASVPVSKDNFASWFAHEIMGDWYPASSTFDSSPVQAPSRVSVLTDRTRKEATERFNNLTQNLEDQFRGSHFWLRLMKELTALNDRHNVDEGHFLLGMAPGQIELHQKSLDSVILKAYRRNILSGASASAPPDGGWITPTNFLVAIKDLVRTTVVVKFLDDGQKVVELIQGVAEEVGAPPPDVDYEARDTGYYAIHTVIMAPFKLTGERPWKVDKVPLPVEIQICTQVQEVVRDLTHKIYERKRTRSHTVDKKWQWNPSCDEFVPNYVAHTLHYCEGMIIRLKKDQESPSDA